MKKHSTYKIIYWVLGFVTSTFITGILLFLIVLNDFGDTEPINFLSKYLINYLIFLGIVLLIVTIFFTFKKKRPNYSYGLLWGLIWCVIILIINSVDTFTLLNPPAFDAIIWKNSNPKPIGMAYRVANDHLAINKSKKEIINMFGENFTEIGKDKIIFGISRYNFTYLEIAFDTNDISKKVIFRNYD